MTGDWTRLVRPRFLKWSAIVFVLLVPFVLHAAWDYAETWRLGHAVARIRENREPLTSQEIHPAHMLAGEAADAARFYRAAAALAGSEAVDEAAIRLRARVSDAMWTDVWPDALIADLRRRVERDEEALRLLDRAAPLTFDGFEPGNVSARVTEMLTLTRVAALRTRLLAVEGDGRGAAASLYAELRLQRTFDFDPFPSGRPGFTAAGLAESLRLLVSRARQDVPALAPLAGPLRELDRDDRLKMHFMRTRASIFENGRLEVRDVINLGAVRTLGAWSLERPWIMKLLNERIETLGALIDGASRPWPRRLDPSGAYLSDSASERRFRQIDTAVSTIVARDAALVRCARVVVAVEQYRRQHGEALPPRLEDLVPAYLDATPIDPFSGRPLRFVALGTGYVVYSLDANRRDEGGRLLTREMLARQLPGMPALAGADLGIRIPQR